MLRSSQEYGRNTVRSKYRLELADTEAIASITCRERNARPQHHGAVSIQAERSPHTTGMFTAKICTVRHFVMFFQLVQKYNASMLRLVCTCIFCEI